MTRLSSYRDSRDLAHVLPFVVFMGFLLLIGLFESFGFTSDREDMPWYRFAPEQWVYPLQTVVTACVLLFFRHHYELKPARGILFGVLIGVVGIAIWIAPGHVFRTLEMEPSSTLEKFGFANREEGFNPTFIRDYSASWYGAAVLFRFLRMVIVVALIEEIFWRGFLMRYLTDLNGDYWKVPFGTHHWRAFLGVTLLVTLAHSPVDYVAAAIYGALAYFVAIRTKSLAACVAMHATANLLLGIYTMATGQWGYW
ncbi:MAG: CAAX prenyl protease-related protein [Planctomycetaceae bacterium]